MADSVRVQGLAEFRKELRRVSAEFPKGIREANLDVARDVASGAQGATMSRQAARAAAALKAGATQRSGYVKLGGVPFALGAEFGAKRYHQFPRWRGNQWTDDGGDGIGYFLHPTIRRMIPEIVETYADRLVDKLAAKAFPS